MLQSTTVIQQYTALCLFILFTSKLEFIVVEYRNTSRLPCLSFYLDAIAIVNKVS